MADIDQIIDRFVDSNSEEMSIALLHALAPKESGGLGHKIVLKRIVDADGWEYDSSLKKITLDSSYFMGDMNVSDMTINLREALETGILKTRASLGSRIGWGSLNVFVGIVEIATGFIGIIVPEPGTTIAGAAVFTLGVNSVTAGFTQLAGANKGNGFNPLARGAGAIGAKISEATGHDKRLGETIARNMFSLASIAVGSFGSIHILRIKGQQFLRAGVGGMPGGATVGRVDMMYGSLRAGDGMTIFNISNNSGQYILRLVTHSGKLVVNGRIVGVKRVLNHETSAKEILKGLIKLCAHGWKAGL